MNSGSAAGVRDVPEVQEEELEESQKKMKHFQQPKDSDAVALTATPEAQKTSEIF
jgi:hypothetical protein